ncbi:MAG: hypothetical protein ACPGWS_09115 [Solirubrobacterales bacterium]
MSGGRRTYIGIAVIAMLALGIVALPEGQNVADLVTGLLGATFLAVLAISAARLYRARSDWFAELPDRHRGLLYGAVAVALLSIVGTARFGELGFAGILLEVLILMACAGAAFWVWRESRRFVY